MAKKKTDASLDDMLQKLVHNRFDMDKFRSLLAAGLGGEEAMAKIFVETIKDKTLKGGAKSMVMKNLFEVLQRKTLSDSASIPPTAILDSIMNRYADTKQTLCQRCQSPLGIGPDSQNPAGPQPQPQGEDGADGCPGPCLDGAGI